MNAKSGVAYARDVEDVGWILFDDPGSRANVFTEKNLNAFAAAVTEAEADAALRALVVLSGKDNVFVAGADLHTVAAFPNAETAAEFSRRGQQLFQRLADFRAPVVAAIHGACVGGGFELALACHWRMATDAGVTRIGLPETSLGTIPGWGGSVRLPRLMSAELALNHILKAQLFSATEALRVGMIDEVVREHELRVRAKEVALALAEKRTPLRPTVPRPSPGWFAQLRESVFAKTNGRQPAMIAAIDVVEQAMDKPVDTALEIEARFFGDVSAGPVCKNLVRVFFLREAARKQTLKGWFEGSGERRADDKVRQAEQGAAQPPIRRVGVVGAGVMGTGIAQWLAAHGFEVVLRDVQAEVLERGMQVIRDLFAAAVERRRLTAEAANSGLHRITTTTEWGGFETCELVIEAIVENADAKQTLFSKIADVVGPAAILASNTSALPIEEIAGHVPHPERTLGLHFFNPVSRMPLVELIIGRHTSANTAERALGLVKALGKAPLLCRSSPGFLITRVLFFYLNAALRLREEGNGTDQIDQAMRDFGWPMGPLRLIDEVGVDVTDFIFRELEHYFPQRFTRSRTCGWMQENGLLGRKNGASRGFYRYDGGGERVNDEVDALLRRSSIISTRSHSQLRQEGLAIQGELMRVMVDEAQRCVDEGVVKSADDVDFAFLSGAGFPAFRGGLLRR